MDQFEVTGRGGGGQLSRQGVVSSGRRRLRDPFSGSEVIDSTVPGVVAFGATTLEINPARAATFPILSQRAAVWEKYVFTKLRFVYSTRTNQFQANGIGTVAMNFDYDASDAAPPNLDTALNSRPVSRGAPYENFVLDVPCDQWAQKEYYLRPGALPGAADIKLYDCGNMHLVVDSTANTSTIGILSVEYEGYFLDQIQPNSAAAPTNNRVASFQSSAGEALATATDHQMLFATEETNGIGAVNTAGSIVLPAGNYLVFGHINSSDTSAEAFTVVMDIEKNGTSIYTTSLSRPEVGPITVGANCNLTADGQVFFSSNGTDALTIDIRPTGAAGTLEGAGTVLILAV